MSQLSAVEFKDICNCFPGLRVISSPPYVSKLNPCCFLYIDATVFKYLPIPSNMFNSSLTPSIFPCGISFNSAYVCDSHVHMNSFNCLSINNCTMCETKANAIIFLCGRMRSSNFSSPFKSIVYKILSKIGYNFNDRSCQSQLAPSSPQMYFISSTSIRIRKTLGIPNDASSSRNCSDAMLAYSTFKDQGTISLSVINSSIQRIFKRVRLTESFDVDFFFFAAGGGEEGEAGDAGGDRRSTRRSFLPVRPRFAVCFIRTIEVFFEKVLSLTQNQLFLLERISIIEQPKEQKEDET